MASRMFGKAVLAVLCVCACAAMGQSAQAIYVDDDAAGGGNGASWQTACKHLQDALILAAAAAKPVEIRIAGGVYKPDQGAGITPGDRSATFRLLNGVTLKGGYAGIAASNPDAWDTALYETVLSGDLAGDGSGSYQNGRDDSCHVVTASLTDDTAVMEAVTITGGKSWSGDSCGFGSGATGRLFIDAASPTIRNCRFISVRSPSGDPAVYLCNASAAIFNNCVFKDDDAGMESAGSSPILLNCLFIGNRMACYHSGGAPSLADCRFESNSTGVEGSGDCDLCLTDCTFVGNSTAVSGWPGVMNVTNCVFESNRKAVDVHSGMLRLTWCDLRGSTNGAVTSVADTVLTRCWFAGNSGGLAAGITAFANVKANGCRFIGNSGMVAGAILGAPRLTLRNCEFSGNSGDQVGAVDAGRDVFSAAGCLFTGNSGRRTGALYCDAEIFSLTNCTFADNRGLVNAVRYDKPGPACPADLTQCIVWDGPMAVLEESPKAGPLAVTYCAVQGGHPGEGNIDADPCFVAPGHWADPNDPSIVLGPDDPCAVWVPGDYHLKSQAGHWDRETEGWKLDEVTSPCIDAGDPNRPIDAEPFPNGAVANMGAYGGTAEASRSYFGGPICETQIAGDINGDCIVDDTDMEILTSHWLKQGWPAADQPPTIVITAPKDGDEFRGTDPMSIRADASDPDGTVIRVLFHMVYNAGTGSIDADPSDGWGYEWKWSSRTWPGTGPQEACTIWAEAMDDGGNIAVSPKIKVTLNGTK